jgi:hypothetical protein
MGKVEPFVESEQEGKYKYISYSPMEMFEGEELVNVIDEMEEDLIYDVPEGKVAVVDITIREYDDK